MPGTQPERTFLEAAEVVLRADGKPLSSRELVARALARGLIHTKGRAPHKTMNARLSEDIRRNPQTIFMRSFHGTFALKDWSSEIQEFKTKKRKLNPMDENILVLQAADFQSLLSDSARLPEYPFFDISLGILLSKSISKKRQLIEEDNRYVQIISLFHVVSSEDILTFKRTSRLPESRLHYTKSINFGGHLQDIDRAPIFEKVLREDINVVFMRELYEELAFQDGFESVRYLGSLYSGEDDFSARHVGVCFQVVPKGRNIRSNEPGFHTSVQFEPIADLRAGSPNFDQWTFLVLRRAGLIT
jgi:predicted NUDIX family phosphoesterase